MMANKFLRSGLILLLAGTHACSSDHGDLRLVVGGLEANRAVTRSIADYIEQDDAFRITRIEQDDISALEMLTTDKADLALVENTSRYRPGVASIMPLYAGVLHISYRGDFRIDSAAEDLVGKTIFAGARDSLSYSLIRGFLASVGIEESSVNITTEAIGEPPDLIAALA